LGRNTRGFIAVDLDARELVYFKDTWISSSNRCPSEITTYRRLAEAGVPFLPDFTYGGAVPFREQGYYFDGSVTKIQERVHQRMVFKKIGRPIFTFHSTRELVTVLYHALQAHDAAVQRARILHRDISDNNIMIDKDGNGMLIDWDLCSWLDAKHSELQRRSITGTWSFMSVAVMEGRIEPHIHNVRDDIEAIVNLLVYYALRHRPN
ncbi:hypothetical protein K488DRAFT_24944, partial [Vararia minispora EC-137]